MALPAVFASPEEEWRFDCLAFAKVKSLQHVEEMRAFYLVSTYCPVSSNFKHIKQFLL